MKMRCTVIDLSIAIALSCLTATAFVSAGDATKRAEELFGQGRVLLDEGKYAEACEAFDESMRLEPGGGTLLNLALCHELLGKYATATREYREALDRAIADGRQDRRRLAHERLDVVSARVARFAVEIDDATNVTVTMDGEPVPGSALERPIALDPGTHTLVVSIPGEVPFEHRFAIPKEDGWRGRVQVPRASVPAAVPPAAVRPVLSPPTLPLSLPKRDAVEQPRTERTTWHWVGLSVGVLGLATSAVTGVEALDAESDANDSCIPERGYCSADGKAAADRANDFAWASTVSLGVGLAGLAVWTWLPKERAESTVGLSTTPGGMLVTTSGSF
jgi:Tetratricopeptide repeat